MVVVVALERAADQLDGRHGRGNEGHLFVFVVVKSRVDEDKRRWKTTTATTVGAVRGEQPKQPKEAEAEKPTCVHACLRMNECTYLELVRAGEDIGLREGALRSREHVGEIRVRAALNNAVVRLI